MNIFANLCLIFIFVYFILFLRFPNIYHDFYIQHKFIIFISLFCFQFILLLLAKIKNRCRIELSQLFQDSLNVGIVGVFGYSLYTDLFSMNYTRKFMAGIMFNRKLNYLFVTVIITLFITLLKAFTIMATNGHPYCIKY